MERRKVTKVQTNQKFWATMHWKRIQQWLILILQTRVQEKQQLKKLLPSSQAALPTGFIMDKHYVIDRRCLYMEMYHRYLSSIFMHGMCLTWLALFSFDSVRATLSKKCKSELYDNSPRQPGRDPAFQLKCLVDKANVW